MHNIVRTPTRRGFRVATVHPQIGEVVRGTVEPAGRTICDNTWVDGRDAAGSYGMWTVTDADLDQVELTVVGDYLTAEAILLERTAWADQPIPANELEG